MNSAARGETLDSSTAAAEKGGKLRLERIGSSDEQTAVTERLDVHLDSGAVERNRLLHCSGANW